MTLLIKLFVLIEPLLEFMKSFGGDSLADVDARDDALGVGLGDVNRRRSAADPSNGFTVAGDHEIVFSKPRLRTVLDHCVFLAR